MGRHRRRDRRSGVRRPGQSLRLFGKQAFSCNLGPGAIARFAGLNALSGAVSGAMADAAVQLLQTGRIDAGRVLNASIQGAFAGAAGFLAARALYQACFTGDMKLLARGKWGRGWKRIDEIGEDDEVLSRDENDPKRPPHWKRVEELFRRFARIVHVHVEGELIRTTGEHPFYEYTKGWINANELQAGDQLATLDGAG